jgi:hypothetical protein
MKQSRRAEQDGVRAPASRTWTRREVLGSAGAGLGAAALGSLLGPGNGLARPGPDPGSRLVIDPLAVKSPHFEPQAKRVILLHMLGGTSQLDLFDHKPMLERHDGEPCPAELCDGARFAQIQGPLRLLGSPYAFAQHGESGTEVSELLPHLAEIVDDITLIKSMQTEQINHAPAQLLFHTGFFRYGRPSFGSWVVHGLGTENEDLPGYVVLKSGVFVGAGSELWSSGFLPSVYRGVEFRSGSDPVFFLSDPKGIARSDRRRILDAIRDLNAENLASVGDPEIATRIAQYELSYRMQSSIPELADLSDEPARVRDLYGAQVGGSTFANNCLLARRLVERGVRFVELFDGGWDHHKDIFGNLPRKCEEIDRASAALVTDLRERGLLEDTLVIFCSEFGRTPLMQRGDVPTKRGRDHHVDAFSIWLAGGGTRPGLSYGQTDDLGYQVVENPVHVHDLQATALHLLGLDHEQLTHLHQGREFRLTDVAGEVVPGILA